MTQNLTPHCGYHAGHPWYYLLGGTVPTLKQIRVYARASDYRGYLAADIDAAHAREEPKRSAALRKIKEKAVADLCRDITIYRQVVIDLRVWWRFNLMDERPSVCAEVHTSMSLKFAHIYNGFAHLETLDSLPQQLDLFGL